jgi:hypothetical protein
MHLNRTRRETTRATENVQKTPKTVTVVFGNWRVVFGNWEVVFGNWEYSETGSYIRKLETAYSETGRKGDGYY